MNKIQIILNVVFAAALVALFVVVYGIKTKPCCNHGAAGTAVVAEGNMPIAYLNVDSLLVNYVFAQEAQDKLYNKQEDATVKLNTKARTLQNEMADFQKKLDNNAFLSQERAQSEYQRLQKKEQELNELRDKLAQDIMAENQQLNMQLADSLNAFLAEFNADGRFQIIMSNTAHDNILMAADGYDVTDAVISGMNARLKK